MTKYETRTAVPESLKGMATAQLFDLWELTETNNVPEIYTVRGWLMDELESRNPRGFNAWLDLDAPDDKDLRKYITVNPMCLDCAKWCDGCNGEQCQDYTGCVYKQLARKMSQLYTARYSDGRVAYERPLDWIYSHQNNASVEITPTIWLWKASDANIYFVDYVGDGIGCTLQTFESLRKAENYRDEIASMTERDFNTWFINRGKLNDLFNNWVNTEEAPQ